MKRNKEDEFTDKVSMIMSNTVVALYKLSDEYDADRDKVITKCAMAFLETCLNGTFSKFDINSAPGGDQYVN